MQSAVRCSALPQFGSQSELERFIKQILQRLPCLARNFAKQQRCVVIDINCEVGYIGFIRFGRWITESSNKKLQPILSLASLSRLTFLWLEELLATLNCPGQKSSFIPVRGGYRLRSNREVPTAIINHS